MKIENIMFGENKTRAAYTPAKKIDLGDSYLIFVSGVQPHKDCNHNAISKDVAEQTRQVFEEINQILEIAGASLDDVVKAVIYLTDMNDFNIVSPIREEYFKNSKPVSTMVEVNKMTREGAKIEIEVTAIVSK